MKPGELRKWTLFDTDIYNSLFFVVVKLLKDGTVTIYENGKTRSVFFCDVVAYSISMDSTNVSR